jgi:putative SOS response-associated peptidase YedK
MLKPLDPATMRCYAVSSRVGNVANDDAECAARVEVAQEQTRLW